MVSIIAWSRVRSSRTAASRRRRCSLASTRLVSERFAEAVRAHWCIETSLHWVLDTRFDDNRTRNRKDHGPENLAIHRKLARNLLRTARPEISILRKRERSCWSEDLSRSDLGQMR